MEVRALSSTIPERETKERVENDHSLRRAHHAEIQKALEKEKGMSP